MIEEFTVSEVVAAAYRDVQVLGDELARADWRRTASHFKETCRIEHMRGNSVKLVLCLSDVAEQQSDRLRLSDFRLSTRALVEYADVVVYRSEPVNDLVLKDRNGQLHVE